jgi:acetyl esterase/lipase
MDDTRHAALHASQDARLDPATAEYLRRMDPEVAPFVAAQPDRNLRDLAAARRSTEHMLEVAYADAARSSTVAHEDVHVPGMRGDPPVRVRVYRPTGHTGATDSTGALPCLYWIHGGGYVLGTVEQDDVLVGGLVETLGCVAVSVDWRRAPEHPFPANPNDCYAGLRWVFEHAGEIGVDTERVVIGGASSGGGSAAALALQVRDRGELTVRLQLLIYPALDDRLVDWSSHEVVSPKVWNRDSALRAWSAYLGDRRGTDEVPAYAAPARADDLRGLAPAFLAVGQLDLHADETVEYARRLMAAGVPTELHVYPSVPHGFYVIAPDAEVSARFRSDRDAALRRAFDTTP